MLRALLFKYICTAYKSDDDPKEAKRFWGSWDTAQGGVMSINQVKTQTEAVVEVSSYLGNMNVSASLLQLHYLAYRIWQLNRLSNFSDSQRNIHYFKYMFKYLVLLSLYYIFWEKKLQKPVVSEVILGANLQHFCSHVLSVFFWTARQLSLGTVMQATLTICCVGSLFLLLKGTDSLARKETKQSTLHTQKKGFEGLIQDQNFLKIITLHRKIQQRNLRIIQNLEYWWPTLPLGTVYHSPLVSSLTAKELGPLGYELLQTEVNVLYLLFKSQHFLTRNIGLTNHFLVIFIPAMMWGWTFSLE